jgi:hypothetical protein
MIAQIASDYLYQLAKAYAKEMGLPLTVVSRRTYGSSSFFAKLRRGEQTITLKKYDEIFRFFQREMPPDADWPCTRAIVMNRRNGK